MKLVMRCFFVLAASLCTAGLSFDGPTASQEADSELLILKDDAARSEPVIEIPYQFPLKARVVDQDGAALPGVQITVNEADLGIITSDTGLFVWPAEVQASDIVRMYHPDYVAVAKPAELLWFDPDSAIYVNLVRYTESFEVTPAGGFFRGNQIILDVPEGAVTESVTVRAALTPISETYADSDAIQAQRLTSIALDPEGQEFLKPVKVSVPLEYQGSAEGHQDVMLLDPATGLYSHSPDASVEVDGNRAIFTLSHFSGYAAGDPSEGISRRRMERTNDYNGDGRITSQDALLVVILSGGTHSASLTQDTEIGSTVMRTSGSGSGASSSEGSSASAGASFGGIGVEVETSVDATEAQEVLNRFGESEGISIKKGFEISLSAGEYDVRCRYFVGIYDYFRVRTWEEIEPGPGERRGLEEAYDAEESHPEDGYEHYRIGAGRTSMAVGRVLFSGDRVAVQKDGDTYKYYRLTADYMIRMPVSVMPVNCNPGPLPAGNMCPPPTPRVELPVMGGDQLGEANFTRAPNGGMSSSRYGGWGILPSSTPTPIPGMECGNELSGFITITNTKEAMSESERSRISSESSAIAASVSATVPLPGGAGASASAGTSSSSSSSESQSSSSGNATTTSTTTEIRWTVHNAHEVHVSDHVLYRLHNIETSRNWEPVSADDVPDGLKSGVSGSPGFGTVGDTLHMRDADGNWFRSSPPTTTEKDIGFALIRLTECLCGDEPAISTPRTTAPQVDGPDAAAPAPAPAPAQTAPPPQQTTPPPRPPVITPGPGEYIPPSERDPGGEKALGQEDVQAAPPSTVGESVTVRFTAFKGQTVLNRDYVGDIQSVSFVAFDNSTRQPDPAEEETVVDQGDRIGINLPDASAIARIVVSGAAGSVILERASAVSVPAEILWPIDGMVDIIAGELDETLRIPPQVFNLNAPPSDYVSTVAGSVSDVIAARSDEIAIRGSNVNLNAAGTEVVIASPDGQSTVRGEVPAWGYRIGLSQEVMDVSQTVSVHAQAIGLQEDEVLVLEFSPLPTQQIEPETVTLRAGQADLPIPVAELQTQQIGPQQFNTRVTLQPANQETSN